MLTEVSVETDDVIVLHAYNCPYHELAQEHRDICEMDEKLMRKVLGSDVNLDGLSHGRCITAAALSSATNPRRRCILTDRDESSTDRRYQ